MKQTFNNIILNIKTTLMGLAIWVVVLYSWVERGDFDIIGIVALLLGLLLIRAKDTVLKGATKIFDAILASIGGGGNSSSDDCDKDRNTNNITIKFDRNKKR